MSLRFKNLKVKSLVLLPHCKGENEKFLWAKVRKKATARDITVYKTES